MVKGHGYSETFSAPPEEKLLPPRPVGEERPGREGGIYIDWGPQLPENYPVDRLTVLVRDPAWVWFHWFLEGGDSEAVRRRAGGEPDWFLVVEGGESRFEYAVPRRCPFWWVRVEPGRWYRARLAARFGGTEVTVCRTGPFRTPRPWVKARAVLPPPVAELVRRHGFAVGPEGALEGAERGEGFGSHLPPSRGTSAYPSMPTSGERA